MCRLWEDVSERGELGESRAEQKTQTSCVAVCERNLDEEELTSSG